MHLTASRETHLSNLEYLRLRNTTIDGKLIHTSEALRVARAFNTNITEVELTDFLKNKRNLNYFQLSGLPSFDISTLRPSNASLGKLYVRQVHLKQSSPVSFHNLTRLFFKNVSVSRSFVGSFPNTFSSVKKVEVGVTLDEGLWEAILNTSAIMQIRLVAYHFYSTPRIDSFLVDAGCPSLYHETLKVVKVDRVWKHVDQEEGIWYNERVRDRFIDGFTLTLSAICIGGLIGNCLSGIVLSQRAMRTSTSVILIGLTLCDTVVLVSYLPSILFLTEILAKYFLKSTTYQGFDFHGMRFTASYYFSYFELYRGILNPLSRTGNLSYQSNYKFRKPPPRTHRFKFSLKTQIDHTSYILYN